MNLNENIRYYRKRRGLTQSQLAEMLSVSAQTVSRWEVGGNMPDVLILPQIADVFNISLDDLFDRHPTNEYHLIQTIYDEMLKISDSETLWDCPQKLHEIRKTSLIAEFSALTVRKEEKIEDFLSEYFSHLLMDELDGSMEQVCDGGFTFSSNRKELPFSTVFEEPENGFGIVFDHAETISEVFGILSDKEVIKALKTLFSKKDGIVFDAEYAQISLGMNNPMDTLNKLGNLRIIHAEEIVMDGNPVTIWRMRQKCGIIALFALMNEYLFHNKSFDHQGNSRTKPFVNAEK